MIYWRILSETCTSSLRQKGNLTYGKFYRFHFLCDMTYHFYIVQFSRSRRTNQDPVCLVVITPVAADYSAVLGDPFFNRYPPSFLSQGYVTAGNSVQGPNSPAICLHGTVPVSEKGIHACTEHDMKLDKSIFTECMAAQNIQTIMLGDRREMGRGICREIAFCR